MKRNALAVLAAMSALACLVILVSWVRSYWTYDELAYGGLMDGKSCGWNAYPSSHGFGRWPPAVPEGARGTVLTCFGKVFLRWNSYDTAPLASARGGGWRSDDNIIPSFSYFYATTGNMTREGSWTVMQASVRHWALAAVFAVVPAVWISMRWRSRAWNRDNPGGVKGTRS